MRPAWATYCTRPLNKQKNKGWAYSSSVEWLPSVGDTSKVFNAQYRPKTVYCRVRKVTFLLLSTGLETYSSYTVYYTVSLNLFLTVLLINGL